MTTRVAHLRARNERMSVGRILLLVAVTALIATGCSALAGGPAAPEEQERQPFSARREGEDGAVVAWSGYVDGYEPGMEASFDISIENGTDEPWPGRFCLQLMDNDGPNVLATLEQRPFNLEPGVGFSDAITVEIPEGLDEGAYGLSLVARGPHGPTVDLVPIKVGQTDEERQSASQRDMDAAVEACPEATGAKSEPQNLVTLAKEDLARRTGLSVDDIVVEDIKEAEFPDASLGVPEPGKTYAQVITPGYVIRLAAEGKTYEYHGAGEQVVLAAAGAEGSSDR
jgi:hypothetical protein